MYFTDPFDRAATRGQTPHVFRAEVRRLLRALADHDRDTALHSLRVWRFAMWTAAEFGLGRRERAQLSVAARLHDIGKVCIPRAVLTKPDRLSPEEYRRVQTHAALGASVLGGLTDCPVVHGVVRWHHERPDGKGYPDGLRAGQVPLLARVVAVADAFDAMTAARPYGRPLPWLVALDVLRGEAGRQFDPTVVDRFTAALRRSVARPAACGKRGWVRPRTACSA